MRMLEKQLRIISGRIFWMMVWAMGACYRYTEFDFVRTFKWATKRHGKPRAIWVFNGLEVVSKELDLWAYANNVSVDFSRLRKPTDDIFIESYDAWVRQECLNQHWFLSISDARLKINWWRKYYDEDRPHSMLCYLTPNEYAEKQVLEPDNQRNLGPIFAHAVV